MGKRFVQDSDYEWDEGEDDCAGSDDDYTPTTPKKKKRTPSTSKKATPKKPKTPRTPKSSSSNKKGKAALIAPKDDSPFPFFDLPAEIIDCSLSDPGLHLRDHLSLAASCRLLRSAYVSPRTSKNTSYTCPIWRVLCSNRAFSGKGWNASPGKLAVASEADEKLLNHLWGREDRVNPSEVKVGARAGEWEDAISAVHTQRITKSTAKQGYKLNDFQLNKVVCIEKRNPHARRGPPMCLYLEAAVESLAFEVHGGAAGHEEWVKKCEARAAKSADTKAKRKAGILETPSPKKKSKTKASAAPPGKYDDASDDEDDEDRDYGWDREGTPTPVAGPSRGH
ncbi:hypothetical protein JCM11641_002748 [Rhodosporidiobolus odoratus]